MGIMKISVCRTVCGEAALTPSLRGLAKIGSSEPIFDWGSVVITIGHSLRQPYRADTSLIEGGKATISQAP